MNTSIDLVEFILQKKKNERICRKAIIEEGGCVCRYGNSRFETDIKVIWIDVDVLLIKTLSMKAL